MPKTGLSNINTNPWRWVPSLYLAEGIPNAVVVTVAVVMLKNLGIDNGHVALYTSLLYLPWVVKPFWAPYVDMFSSKRRWILVMQLLMAAGFGIICGALHLSSWLAFALGALWWVAITSATHDIAADGFYLLALDRTRQAAFVGIRSTFYRAANMLASGGVVWCAGQLIKSGLSSGTAWSTMMGVLTLFFLLAALYHAYALPRPRGVEESVKLDFANAFRTFFCRPGFGVALAFMLLYRLPEAILSKTVQPFLLDPKSVGGLGLSVDEVGVVNGIFGVAGIVLGGIIGGLYIARYGLRRSLWPMALMLTVPSAFYWYLAARQPENMTLISTGIALEQFGYGFGFTAYMVYMMKFSEGSEYTTSHYAFCTGLMALGLMLPGLIAGKMSIWLGYEQLFAWVMVLCLFTFIVTHLAHKQLNEKRYDLQV